MPARRLASGRLLRSSTALKTLTLRPLALGTLALGTLAGCASTSLGPTVQVMPGHGKGFDTFQSDNAGCKNFAANQVRGHADAANNRAVGTAFLATALGAGLGVAGGAVGGDAGGGAAPGAGLGAGTGSAIAADNNSNDQMGIQAQYDAAFSQCMYTKGEQVPGYAVAAYVPMATAAAPDTLIRATQTELIRLGYLQGAADGYATPRTRAAISSYEQANGMPVDGSSSSRLSAKLQGTPSNATAATASAPSAWVAPAGSPSMTPASAPSGGWVAPSKSGAAASATPAAATSAHDEEFIESFFPWPPPQPFLYEIRPRQTFSRNVTTLSDISELLKTKLAHSGYSDFRFFSIRRDGFALVTRMERIDAQQRSIAGPGRWEDAGGLALYAGSFSIPAYLRALFTRRTGNFRVFVMIVTPENVVPDPDKQLQPETVQDWQRRGSLTLPDFLGRLPFSDRHKVYVLVYEFRKEEGQEPKPVKDGTVIEHLNAAGIQLWNPS
jgi:hypothetical protein